MFQSSRSFRVRSLKAIRSFSFRPTGVVCQSTGELTVVPPQRYSARLHAPSEPSVPLSDLRISDRQVELLFQQLPARIASSQRNARISETTAEAARRSQSHPASFAHMLLVRKRLRPADIANPAKYDHQLPAIALGNTADYADDFIQDTNDDSLGFSAESGSDADLAANSSGCDADLSANESVDSESSDFEVSLPQRVRGVVIV